MEIFVHHSMKNSCIPMNRCKYLYLFGCRGVVQLGVPDPFYNRGGLGKVGARKLFLFTESSLVVEKKNPGFILLSHSNRIICLLRICFL